MAIIFSIYNSTILLLPLQQVVSCFVSAGNPTITDFAWFIPEIFLLLSLFILFLKNILQKNFYYFLNNFYYELKLLLVIVFFVFVAHYYYNWLCQDKLTLVFNTNVFFNTHRFGYLPLYIRNPLIENGSVIFFNHLVVDNLSTVLKIFLLTLFIPLFFLFDFYLKKSSLWSLEFLFLIVLSLFFLLVSISAHNLFTMFVSLEGSVLILLVLSAAQNSSIFSLEAALKGLIGGALSFSLTLLGLFFILLASGSLFCNDIFFVSTHAGDISFGFLALGSSFLIVGFFFKFCTFPFHFFFLDVYDGAPLVISAQFLVPVKFTYFIVFTNIFLNCLVVPFSAVSKIFIPFVLFSLIYGPLVTISQRKLKRLLSYSSMNNGNLLLLTLLTVPSIVGSGVLSSIYYSLFIYFFTFNVVFIFLLSKDSNIFFLNVDSLTLSSFSGLGKINFFFCMSLAIPFLSIMGLPPFAGFFGKYALLKLIMEARSYSSVFIFLLSNLISFAYYLAFIKLLFSGNPLKLRFASNKPFSSSFYFFYMFFSCSSIMFFLLFSPYLSNFLDGVMLLHWNQDNYSFLTKCHPGSYVISWQQAFSGQRWLPYYTDY